MIQIQTLLAEARQRFCNYRNIYNAVNDERFAKAYDAANDAERETVEFMMVSGQLDALKQWIMSATEKENHATLKEKARRLSIPNWSRLSKLQLLDALEQHGRKANREVRSGETVLD